MPNDYQNAKLFIEQLNKLLSSYNVDIRVKSNCIAFDFGDLDELENTNFIVTNTDIYTPQEKCFHVRKIEAEDTEK